MIVHQLPAPLIVTSSTRMWRFTWYVPAGMKTILPLAFAAAMAESNAPAESTAPVGSAPKSSTDKEFGTFRTGGETFSKSTRSITVQAAFVPAGTETRTLSPMS